MKPLFLILFLMLFLSFGVHAQDINDEPDCGDAAVDLMATVAESVIQEKKATELTKKIAELERFTNEN